MEERTQIQEEIEQEFADFISRQKWIFAKRYAAFCPHEYIVKDRIPEFDRKNFEKFAQFIRDFGWEALYEKMKPNKYYSMGDYYYWTMGAPIPETIILNRARFDNYIFEVDDFGDLRCRYKYARRKKET